MQQKQTVIETETIGLEPIGGSMNQAPRSWWRQIELSRLWIRQHRWLVLLVWMPTLCAAGYYGLLAADRYQSEAAFIVRSQGSFASGSLPGLLPASAGLRSGDDAFVIHAYMRSRDAILNLKANADLMRRLSRASVDPFWRYPPLFLEHNEERLWLYFNRLLAIDFDSTTGISTLKVQAFQPDDARIIAAALLRDAEALINRLSERAQGDAVRTATTEVERGRNQARAALDAITDFRRRHGMVDPGRVSAAALETMTKLAVEVAQTKASLAELNQSSPSSPQVAPLRHRITALESQIEKERATLVGADTSLAPLIAEYERLALEREFAERTFTSAQAALDAARLQVQRQRLFLEQISRPAAADYPQYPKSTWGILAVAGICFMLYSIVRRLLADTRAHAGH